MDMSQKIFGLSAETALRLFPLIMFALWLGVLLTSTDVHAQGERRLETRIPANVPIKVSIKPEKEAGFRDLQNERWVREFELEVLNTGPKPIYFLFIYLITDVSAGGEPLMFSLVHGRPELGGVINKAQPGDIPIKPGEKVALKIHPRQVPLWERRVREKTHPDASRMRTKLELVSFGDGSGYIGNIPYPPGAGRPPVLDDRLHRRPKVKASESSIARR
ncbi:MAG TPA: hypothetical protein VMS31_15245 [Pyrinomonadaceae bacterium]|nr:hypothetical protein [Pyrinomonadaceae bacterium]